jgi:hypothetical protein
MALSDLLQGCSNKSDTIMIYKQECYKVHHTNLEQYCYVMTNQTCWNNLATSLIIESLSSTSNTNTDTDVFTSVLILVPGILKR